MPRASYVSRREIWKQQSVAQTWTGSVKARANCLSERGDLVPVGWKVEAVLKEEICVFCEWKISYLLYRMLDSFLPHFLDSLWSLKAVRFSLLLMVKVSVGPGYNCTDICCNKYY